MLKLTHTHTYIHTGGHSRSQQRSVGYFDRRKGRQRLVQGSFRCHLQVMSGLTALTRLYYKRGYCGVFLPPISTPRSRLSNLMLKLQVLNPRHLHGRYIEPSNLHSKSYTLNSQSPGRAAVASVFGSGQQCNLCAKRGETSAQRLSR